jgi:hypothetical protein
MSSVHRERKKKNPGMIIPTAILGRPGGASGTGYGINDKNAMIAADRMSLRNRSA